MKRQFEQEFVCEKEEKIENFFLCKVEDIFFRHIYR